MKHMKNTFSLTLLFLGIFSSLCFLLFKNAIIFGICPETTVLSSGTTYCKTFASYADYLWPLWDFSRALMVVGLLAYVRTRIQKTLFWWSIIAALVTTVAVIIAPSISSDFLVPIEKKTVGTLFAFGYFAVSVIIALWDLFRKGK